MPSIEQRLRAASFPTVRKGYSPDDVDAFLDAMADEAAVLLTAARAEGVRLRTLERELTALQGVGGDPSDVFLSAADAKGKLLEAAHEEAEEILAAARASASGHRPGENDVERALDEAQAIENAARTIAEKIVEDAREQARSILSTATQHDRSGSETLQQYG